MPSSRWARTASSSSRGAESGADDSTVWLTSTPGVAGTSRRNVLPCGQKSESPRDVPVDEAFRSLHGAWHRDETVTAANACGIAESVVRWGRIVALSFRHLAP